jgi:hypothetical protein
MTFTVSRTFIKDFAYVANFYKWDAAEIEEFKGIIRSEGNGEMMRYIEALAKAHRAGYEQNRSNGFVRLIDWYERQGQMDPFH